jgi:HPt (histidine-containing phosphotransfer) domain-containing protein
MDDYVTKPVAPQALAEAMEKWLQPKAESRQPLAGAAEKKVAVASAEKKIPIFERARLLDQVLNDEELARQVVDVFLKDLPGQIKQLQDYAAAGAANNVERQAHKIKSASATIGGEALRAVAAALEQAGKAGDLDLISARMVELDAQFKALQEALKREI